MYTNQSEKATFGNNDILGADPIMTHLTSRFGRLFITLFFFILLSAACDALPGSPGVDAGPSPTATAPSETPQPEATIESLPTPQLPAPVSSLRLWIPPEIGARTELGSDEWTNQIRVYRTIHPNLDIITEQKPIEGQGGLLNYLQTGGEVAPSVMPDIVAVPASLLADSRVQDLFFPLEGLIDPAFPNDIYPAPATQIADEGHLYGYPFASVGLTHLVYNSDVITDTVSLDWTRFISDTNHTLVFPADSREGAMLGLQFYLAEGGSLLNPSGQVILEAEPLARALEQIAVNKGNLLQSHQLKTLDEAWQYYQLGLSDTIWMRAEHLLGRRAADPTLIDRQGFSAVPGPNGALVPLTTSWAWAITTSDPARQAAAADLILYLTTPDNLALWSERNQVMPARRSAMALLAESNPYYRFLDEQSEFANAMPVSETSRVLDVIGDAVFQVLATDGSPAAIAEQAVVALRQ